MPTVTYMYLSNTCTGIWGIVMIASLRLPVNCVFHYLGAFRQRSTYWTPPWWTRKRGAPAGQLRSLWTGWWRWRWGTGADRRPWPGRATPAGCSSLLPASPTSSRSSLSYETRSARVDCGASRTRLGRWNCCRSSPTRSRARPGWWSSGRPGRARRGSDRLGLARAGPNRSEPWYRYVGMTSDLRSSCRSRIDVRIGIDCVDGTLKIIWNIENL